MLSKLFILYIIWKVGFLSTPRRQRVMTGWHRQKTVAAKQQMRDTRGEMTYTYSPRFMPIGWKNGKWLLVWLFRKLALVCHAHRLKLIGEWHSARLLISTLCGVHDPTNWRCSDDIQKQNATISANRPVLIWTNYSATTTQFSLIGHYIQDPLKWFHVRIGHCVPNWI